jgi:hypothetical protein
MPNRTLFNKWLISSFSNGGEYGINLAFVRNTVGFVFEPRKLLLSIKD